MLSRVFSAGLYGIDGFMVSVEVDGQPRLPEFELVGLPDAAVKEAKERVRTACVNSGFRFPEAALLVNLAPADRRKEGSGFDMAILAGILAVSGTLRPGTDFSDKCFVGELSLSGDIRSHVRGRPGCGHAGVLRPGRECGGGRRRGGDHSLRRADHAPTGGAP